MDIETVVTKFPAATAGDSFGLNGDHGGTNAEAAFALSKRNIEAAVKDEHSATRSRRYFPILPTGKARPTRGPSPNRSHS